MSETTQGPWAWRLRDLNGEPGPWHVAVYQRPAMASGDNIEVIDVPEMAEELERLKANLKAEADLLCTAVFQLGEAEIQRDALSEVAKVWVKSVTRSDGTVIMESDRVPVALFRVALEGKHS